jgi:hypothetical protein
MIKIFFINILFFFITSCSFSQTRSYPLWKVNSDNFALLLDSIIDFEKKCDYYEPLLQFSYSETINNYGIIDIQIASTDCSINNLKIIKKSNFSVILENNLNCFIYNNHIFLFDLETDKMLTKNFITNTDNIVLATFSCKSDYIGLIEDDRFSYWLYSYIDKKITFLGRSSVCE